MLILMSFVSRVISPETVRENKKTAPRRNMWLFSVTPRASINPRPVLTWDVAIHVQ